MKTISIIQPDEFGSDFKYEGGLWHVRFPPGKPNIDPASKDAGNAVRKGTDGGAYLGEDILCAYAITQDNTTKKIHLYQYPVGGVFSPETATLVSTVNMVDLQAVFDDVAIDGSVITFTDADTGAKMTIDTDTLQRIDGITTASNVLQLTVLNGITNPELLLVDYVGGTPNPLAELVDGDVGGTPNLLTESPAGLLVDGDVVGEQIAEGLGDAPLNTNLYRYDSELKAIRHNVNNNELLIPQIQILNSKGDLVGLIDDIQVGVTVYSVVSDLDYSFFEN